MATTIASLNQLIAPVVVDLGYEFWGLEYQPQAGVSLLRVYIESADGIAVEDCTTVSRELSVLLDVEDPIHSEYRLEVSSPGMARPFFSLEQYARYVGAVLKVKLRFSFEGRKNFSGQLVAVENDELIIRDGDNEYCLPYEQLEKGTMVPQFD